MRYSNLLAYFCPNSLLFLFNLCRSVPALRKAPHFNHKSKKKKKKKKRERTVLLPIKPDQSRIPVDTSCAFIFRVPSFNSSPSSHSHKTLQSCMIHTAFLLKVQYFLLTGVCEICLNYLQNSWQILATSHWLYAFAVFISKQVNYCMF